MSHIKNHCRGVLYQQLENYKKSLKNLLESKQDDKNITIVKDGWWYVFKKKTASDWTFVSKTMNRYLKNGTTYQSELTDIHKQLFALLVYCDRELYSSNKITFVWESSEDESIIAFAEELNNIICNDDWFLIPQTFDSTYTIPSYMPSVLTAKIEQKMLNVLNTNNFK